MKIILLSVIKFIFFGLLFAKAGATGKISFNISTLVAF
jgi:hypothetical protein